MGPSVLLNCLFCSPGGTATGEPGTASQLPDLRVSFLPTATRGCKDHGQLPDLGAAGPLESGPAGSDKLRKALPARQGKPQKALESPRTAGKHSRRGASAALARLTGGTGWQFPETAGEQHPPWSPHVCVPEPVTPGAAAGWPETLPAPLQTVWLGPRRARITL